MPTIADRAYELVIQDELSALVRAVEAPSRKVLIVAVTAETNTGSLCRAVSSPISMRDSLTLIQGLEQEVRRLKAVVGSMRRTRNC